MKALDLRNTNGDTKPPEKHIRIPEGTYVATIIAVTDNPEKSYLEIHYDIAEGPYANYFSELCDRAGFWAGRMYRSYKPNCLNMFKHYITTLEKSNPSLSWDLFGISENDEHDLEGCKMGIVLENEDYTASDGSTKQRPKVKKVITVDEARSTNNMSTEGAVVIKSSRGDGHGNN